MLNALPPHQAVMAALWLAIIVLCILGISRAVRFLPQHMRLAAKPPGQDLQGGALTVRGSVALDLRRRVYLIEAAGQPALILTGGTADVMLALTPVEG